MFKAMAEIFYGNSGALCVIVFNAGTFAALTAYGDVKCLVALFFELIYGDVLADFSAGKRLNGSGDKFLFSVGFVLRFCVRV